MYSLQMNTGLVLFGDHDCPLQVDSRQTLVIRALADALLEGEESFTVQLLAVASDAVIHPIDGQSTVLLRVQISLSRAKGLNANPTLPNVLSLFCILKVIMKQAVCQLY